MMNDSFEKFNLRGWEMWQLFPFGLYIQVRVIFMLKVPLYLRTRAKIYITLYAG